MTSLNDALLPKLKQQFEAENRTFTTKSPSFFALDTNAKFLLYLLIYMAFLFILIKFTMLEKAQVVNSNFKAFSFVAYLNLGLEQFFTKSFRVIK